MLSEKPPEKKGLPRRAHTVNRALEHYDFTSELTVTNGALQI